MTDLDLAGMDPQARRFLAMVALGASDASEISPEERRRSFEKLMRFSKRPAPHVEVEHGTIQACGDHIRFRAYVTDRTQTILPGVIYFHGGGLVAGSIDTHDSLCRSLALETGCRILSIDYRLAPEHPFPTPILDALLATRWIIRHARQLGIDEHRIAVAGDSGGATLATIAANVFRSHLKAQVLLCPVLDFGGASESRRAFGRGFLLDAATMARDLAFYAPRRVLDDPRISPLRSTYLQGMPATIIHTAGFDPLSDEGAAYAARLEAAGVGVTYTCHKALVHHFYGLTGVIAAANAALSEIATDIRAALA